MQIEQFKTEIIPLRQKLFLFALKTLQNEEDAEDAVQETLLRLWKLRIQLDKVSSLGAFSMQMLKNICIDRLRAAKKHLEINDFGADNDTPYLETERKDAVSLVKKIIENLPELQRITIQMRDVEGYELQEIADIIGRPVNAVTVNLSRARKKVRDTFIKVMNYNKTYE